MNKKTILLLAVLLQGSNVVANSAEQVTQGKEEVSGFSKSSFVGGMAFMLWLVGVKRNPANTKSLRRLISPAQHFATEHGPAARAALFTASQHASTLYNSGLLAARNQAPVVREALSKANSAARSFIESHSNKK